LDFEEQQKLFRIGLSFEGDPDIPNHWRAPAFYLRTSRFEEDLSIDFSPHPNALATSTSLGWSISLSGYISTTRESESNSLLPSLIDLSGSINNEREGVHVFAGRFHELSATAAGSEAEAKLE
jgi:hypothetical protein